VAFEVDGGLELARRADVIFAAGSATLGHPEQTLGIVTVLGGIYRVAERAGRAWGVGGVAAADEAMFDIAMRLFDTDDAWRGIRSAVDAPNAGRGIRSAVDALNAGRPRPVMDFNGH
jgi:hypothetical protein